LFKRFPTSDTYKGIVQAIEWYSTIDERCSKAYKERYGIKTLYVQQQDVINTLSEINKILIIEEHQLSRACRMMAMVMQVCVSVTAMKAKMTPVLVDENDYKIGCFAHPFVLIIMPDDDVDPSILMDAYTLAHHTRIDFAVPNICVFFPGDEELQLLNSLVVCCSLNKLKQLIGQGLIGLSCVQRIIVDEPLYLDVAGFNDLRMIYRHPDMNVHVDAAFIGRSYTPFTTKNINDLFTYRLPYWNPHTVESRQASRDEWGAYADSL